MARSGGSRTRRDRPPSNTRWGELVMPYRISVLTAAIAASLLCTAPRASAQDAPSPPPAAQTNQQPGAPTRADQKNAKDLAGVTVTGIRASMAKSLDTKRDADAIVDAI